MLQMSKTNRDLICIFLCLLKDHALQIAQTVQDLIDLFSQIQTGVYLALIVTASGCMQLLAHITDLLDQTALHTHMNIFIIHIEYDPAICDLLFDLLQTCNDLIFFFLGYDPLSAQHGHMGNTAVNILIVHSLIKKDGCIVFFYKLIHVFFKSSAPQTCHLSLLLYLICHNALFMQFNCLIIRYNLRMRQVSEVLFIICLLLTILVFPTQCTLAMHPISACHRNGSATPPVWKGHSCRFL